MSHQYPHQPPMQPGPPPAAKPKKPRTVLIATLVGAFCLFVGCGTGVGLASGEDAAPAAVATDEPTEAAPSEEPTTEEPEEEPTEEPTVQKPPKVIFKVWGDAPSGVDITYGNDGTNHAGKLKAGKFRKTMKLDEGALYYSVTAQLQGGGNIKCSVSYDGQTEKGAASGGYNICSAQLNGGITGW